MARFLSLMVILGVLGLFAGQSNAFSMACYAQCMMVCMQGGIGGASSSNHGLQPKQQSPAVVFDNKDSGYDTDGLISCGIKCIKECRHPPAMPPPETPVPLPPTPEAPQVPAPVPPTPEAPQVPAPVPPTPEAPKPPEAPQPSTPSPSPSPPPCVALASEEVAGIVGKLNDYCKLGCATHLCARLSTAEKLAPAEIMNCVENCSQMCNRRY